MRAQKIAGKQKAVLTQVGEHGFRPMNPWRKHEFEGLPAQIEKVMVFDRPDAIRWQIEQMNQLVFAFVIGHDQRFGILG